MFAKIRSHPTRYAHTLFRSRLEARWAAFFDLVGWEWEYEPSDDAGWVPDFILRASGLAVEVKPIEWSADERICLQVARERADLEKLRKSDRLAALILGAYPLSLGRVPTLGVLWLKYIEAENRHAKLARLARGEDRQLDFRADGSFDYGWFASGEPEFRNEKDPVTAWPIESAWREAGNRTQWRGGAPAKHVSLFDD